MPFVKQERRDEIEKLGLVACKDVGDICFVFYKRMVFLWKQEPRWTTAHKIYKEFILNYDENAFYWGVNDTLVSRFDLLDVKTGCDLAWAVFFQKFVMAYEGQKIIENGDIQ